MEIVSKKPEDFINSCQQPLKGDLKKLDQVISKVMKGKERALWQGVFWGGSQQNIIGYGHITHKRPKENVDWFMIGLGPQKNYISLYISAVEDGEYLSEKYGKSLGKVKVGKSSIGFKSLEDIDLNALEHLITRARDIMVVEFEK